MEENKKTIPGEGEAMPQPEQAPIEAAATEAAAEAVAAEEAMAPETGAAFTPEAALETAEAVTEAADEAAVEAETGAPEDAAAEAAGEGEAQPGEGEAAQAEPIDLGQKDGEDAPPADEPPTGKLLGSLRLVYEEQDLVDAMKMQQEKMITMRIFTYVLLALPFVMIGFSLYRLIGSGDQTQISNIVLYVILLAFIGYTYFIAPTRNARRTFRGIDEDQKKGFINTFTFYEDGVFIEGQDAKQTFRWKDFKEVIECPAGILMTTFGRSAVFFPARLLESVDRRALSEVLMENFGAKYRVTKYAGKKPAPQGGKAGDGEAGQ